MTDVATKDDVRAVKDQVQQLETSLRGEVEQMGTALRGEVEQMGTALRGEMEQMGTALRGEMKQMETSLRGEIGSLREEVHFMGIRFEQLDSKVTALGEGLVGFREYFTDEIRKLREELSGRITTLEEVVRGNSIETRALQSEVANLRRRFDRYEQETEIEKRVTEIEKRLGIR